MTGTQPIFSRLLCTAPLLYAGLIGGQPSVLEGSCVAPLTKGSVPYTMEYKTSSSVLARGYEIIAEANLLYSMKVVEKLWNYFVNEAAHFSPEQIDVIDKEFWNLG
ncbi:MAG: hypothetical protein WCG29_14235 [Desulfomonile sp.]|jgi:hypothetical protein